MDIDAIDHRAKQVQGALFKTYGNFGSEFNASVCQEAMTKIFSGDFNASDAANVEPWIGVSCDFTPPPTPGPADPTCAHGVLGKASAERICCAKECGVCAHPSAACDTRPGAKENCCPSVVAKAKHSCATHAAPCVLSSKPDSPENVRWKTIEDYEARKRSEV